LDNADDNDPEHYCRVDHLHETIPQKARAFAGLVGHPESEQGSTEKERTNASHKPGC
jgi:hypothetical protein